MNKQKMFTARFQYYFALLLLHEIIFLLTYCLKSYFWMSCKVRTTRPHNMQLGCQFSEGSAELEEPFR